MISMQGFDADDDDDHVLIWLPPIARLQSVTPPPIPHTGP